MPKVKVSDIQMYYEEMGDPEGEPLLVTSGWSKIATATERYRKIFGNQYRLIRNEHRGMGSTDAPDGPYSITQLADDLNGLLEHLDLRNLRVLAGGGMGSLVGIALAATYPERVRSLVLGAPSVKADNFMRSLYYYWRDLYNVSPELWARDITLSDYTRETWNERPEIIEKALAGRINDDPFARPEIYGWLLDAYTSFDATDYLPRIACPTLVVCGGFEDRPTGPEYAREVYARIPGAKLHIIQNAAHAYQGERTEEFAKVVNTWFERT
ncbi:hypothetical protein EOS_34055 [Caballeronia mineralivorans PML1(12)]|jgi:3-oxoadipate enol-lactonase|uniref:AB hydrolase-1 domain-containing protein n=1 Tax=Caballeronia mineralivorans PML1(12) TaxID=908627 RepID=A0A0J1CN05_9BURK|nr:alpha/beta hydrolase [Caballeronia mineralivorans]KLU21791.1 hypothetical protein EOS_34055 [Caballeronia mineralivorans PML1(12)]